MRAAGPVAAPRGPKGAQWIKGNATAAMPRWSTGHPVRGFTRWPGHDDLRGMQGAAGYSARGGGRCADSTRHRAVAVQWQGPNASAWSGGDGGLALARTKGSLPLPLSPQAASGCRHVPVRVPWAAKGVEQLPPMAKRLAPRARPVTVSQVGMWARRRKQRRSNVLAILRTSMPRAPHGGGQHGGGGECGADALAHLQPFEARCSGQNNRVVLAFVELAQNGCRGLPRRGSIQMSGRRACSSTWRRRLDVPTTAPCGSASRLA